MTTIEAESPGAEEFAEELAKAIKFQRKWQAISMTVYWGSTILSITFGSAATVLGALNQGTAAAVSAAIATVLIGIEKSLLFRERWRLHLRTVSQLAAIQLDVKTQQVDLKDGVRRFNEANLSYSDSLPIVDQHPE